MSGQPVVSVIVPAYNAERYIGQALDSALRQTCRDLEVLVVDDGSQDRTAEIVRAMAQRDGRVRLLEQPNQGVASARNLALAHARGQFVAPLDADDLWHPEKLEKQVLRMAAGASQPAVVYVWSERIGECGRKLEGECRSEVSGQVFEDLVCHNFIGCASVPLIRRSCLKQVGGYNVSMRAQHAQGCEDWDLLLRLAEKYPFAVVPEVLLAYRQVENSMCRDYASMARSHQFMLGEIAQKHPELSKEIFRWSVGNFYQYLSRLCKQDQRRLAAMAWLCRGIFLDGTAFSHEGVATWVQAGQKKLVHWKRDLAPDSKAGDSEARRESVGAANGWGDWLDLLWKCCQACQKIRLNGFRTEGMMKQSAAGDVEGGLNRVV
jgi:glycosyltransferase involved in cell wall biosynthesis